MSKREGKYFNMGTRAAADELEKALKQLQALNPTISSDKTEVWNSQSHVARTMNVRAPK